MKAIDKLIEKYKGMSKTLQNALVIQNLEQLKADLKKQHKKDLIEFHVAVMEKGLESEASEYKKSEWDRLVRHQAKQYYNENH